MPEERAPQANRRSRLPSDSLFELLAARADQVIADVRAARVRRPFRNLPRAFEALQRHPHLRVAGRLRQLFDHMAIAIAADEIHASIHGGRIALKNLFDQTDVLEELAPVECRHEAEAADQVRHEGLLRRLMPRLRTDRVLDRLAACRQRRIELAPKIRGGLVFPRALEQPDHERGMHV